jgi:hypothetical protein
MTQRNVETLIGRLVTDSHLRRRFSRNPAAVLEEFRRLGHDLTVVELDALASTEARALGSLAEAVDRRIRKAVLGSEPEIDQTAE